MTECPHCHREIEINEINHGTLFNCPLCNAVYFVGWDGQPELPPTAEEMAAENIAEAVSGDPGSADSSGTGASIHVENAFIALESGNDDVIIDNSTYESGNEDLEGVQHNAPAETVFGPMPTDADGLPESLESSVDTAGYESGEMDTDPIPAGDYDFSQPLGDQPVAGADNLADEPGFADVTKFANSQADAGPMTYSLKITGIDSGKIYGQLKEALSDSRFGWDVPDLMKTVKNGTLNLKGLNPAKAFVVVNRIKYLPLQISWRQDVLSAP